MPRPMPGSRPANGRDARSTSMHPRRCGCPRALCTPDAAALTTLETDWRRFCCFGNEEQRGFEPWPHPRARGVMPRPMPGSRPANGRDARSTSMHPRRCGCLRALFAPDAAAWPTVETDWRRFCCFDNEEQRGFEPWPDPRARVVMPRPVPGSRPANGRDARSTLMHPRRCGCLRALCTPDAAARPNVEANLPHGRAGDRAAPTGVGRGRIGVAAAAAATPILPRRSPRAGLNPPCGGPPPTHPASSGMPSCGWACSPRWLSAA